MSEWTVVTVLVCLGGFLLSIVKPIISLNSTITRLTEAVKVLEKNIEAIADKNGEAHARLWQKEGEQDEMLREHELRLRKVEEKGTA
ncbi:MAG: hypothetical protein ACI4PC_07310 [Oscillospiraceae bacterium]